jgi:threonine aldolase
MNKIDLRSDTFTTPTPQMLEAMINAKVGDDVYGEDESINSLQDRVSELCGKEAALFVPSGTMSNQIGLAINTNNGDEVITDADAHIYYYETAGPSLLSRVQIRPIKSNNGMPDLNEIEDSIRPDIYYFPNTSLICLENTHNRHGGAIINLEYIKELKKLAEKYGIKLHLDGARLWNASSATGISIKEYVQYFDSVSLCFSKGLGAPVGSILVSNKENIKKALKWRKILGGGMRQAGMLAAACDFALDNVFPIMSKDHSNAKDFSQRLITFNNGIILNIDSVQTNIVVFELPKGIDAKEFELNCKNENLMLSGIGGRKIRAVFYYQITTIQAQNAAEIIQNVLNQMRNT